MLSLKAVAVRSILYLAPPVWVYVGYRQPGTIDKLAFLIDQTGRWALTFLLLATAMSSVRGLACRACRAMNIGWGKRLSDWNILIRERRALGLYSFLLACAHVGAYYWLEQGGEWAWFIEDIRERPFIAVGVVGFALLIPLAVTSFNRAMRLMGRRWKQLHRSVYLIGLLALVHLSLLKKATELDHWPFIVVFVLIVVTRVLTRRRGSYRHDDGEETSRGSRESKPLTESAEQSVKHTAFAR